MKNKYILLHIKENNAAICINAEDIILAYSSAGKLSNSIICLSNSPIPAITVSESVEKIYNKVKFVYINDLRCHLRLHLSDNNTSVLIKLSAVSYMAKDIQSKRTEIVFKDSVPIDLITVNESPDQIYEANIVPQVSI